MSSDPQKCAHPACSCTVTKGGPWGKYCSEKTQAAFNWARLFTDPAKRKAAYEAALTEIEADRPLIYLYHQALIFAHSAKLQGYRQPPDGIIRIQDMKLAP